MAYSGTWIKSLIVSRAQLEDCLSRLSSQLEDPCAGIFGPGSKVWEIDRESIVFLAGGRAALLQLAHPAVAHAIDQHSTTITDPAGRFARTFEQVFAMVFGDSEEAFVSARRVHAMHQRISGQIEEAVGSFELGAPYQANDTSSLIWVYATLIDSALMSYELIMGPLPMAERQRYYAESRRFMLLFGVAEQQLPKDYVAFRDYFESMLHGGTIVVGSKAGEIAEFLFHAPRGRRTPLFRWLEIMTMGLLPEPIRSQYSLRWGPRDRQLYVASLALIRRTYPRLPLRLRVLPAYQRAQGRLEGREGFDKIGRNLERWVYAVAGVQGPK